MSRFIEEWGAVSRQLHSEIVNEGNYRLQNLLTTHILHIAHERFRLAYIKYKLSKKKFNSLPSVLYFLVIVSQQSKYQRNGNSYVKIGRLDYAKIAIPSPAA